jgi:hypothetical protein
VGATGFQNLRVGVSGCRRKVAIWRFGSFSYTVALFTIYIIYIYIVSSSTSGLLKQVGKCN